MKLSVGVSGIGFVGGICYHTWKVEDRKKRRAQQAPLRPMLGSVDDVTAGIYMCALTTGNI